MCVADSISESWKFVLEDQTSRIEPGLALRLSRETRRQDGCYRRKSRGTRRLLSGSVSDIRSSAVTCDCTVLDYRRKRKAQGREEDMACA